MKELLRRLLAAIFVVYFFILYLNTGCTGQPAPGIDYDSARYAGPYGYMEPSNIVRKLIRRNILFTIGER